MAVATTANYAALGAFINKAGLEVAEPLLQYSKFGKSITLPQKSSKVIKFRRYERIAPTSGKDAASLKSLVEGVVPSTSNPTVTDYSLTLSQYGNVMEFSDQAIWVNEVSVDTELLKRNEENKAQTIDSIYRDALMAGTQFGRLTDSIGTIGAGARSTVNGIINAVALDKVIRALKLNDAKFIKSIKGASTKVGTSGLRPAYIAIIDPQCEYDVERIQGFKSIADYPDSGDILEGEVGAYKNIRFVTSTLAKNFQDSGAAVGSGFKSTTGSNNDVYPVLIVAENAYACVDLASSSETIYNPQNKSDKSDPLNQFATLGWKAMSGSLILNDSWIYRLEVAATA